ncbi:helix-turn-helix transcriptional regulator [Youhaiella tibetensis]|uniref:Helix-turn-helix transcriptional regulator n=1 Tax=Paradevosia tibetensis TaxID=1447062 RepID=A0A5B9DHX4_9HYPH|nr:helix-turn-helix transcriptional regulator [Youhaiella tibetensis]
MEHPLRIARSAAKRSVEDVALEAGVTKSTISRVETWMSDPSVSLIRTLCVMFPSLTPNDFIIVAERSEHT